MNKLLLDSSNNLIESGTKVIELKENQILKISGEANLTNIDLENHSLDITLLDNSSVIFHKVNIASEDTILNLTLQNECNLEMNLLILNSGDNTFTLNINMVGNKSICKIKARVLNKNSDKIHFICNGKILENTYDNELIEDLKGLITSSDEIKISPNIEALTSELNANHLVTIGSFSKNELFYLNSKGLSDKQAKKMLTESFISEVTNEVLKEKIKTEVITIE